MLCTEGVKEGKFDLNLPVNGQVFICPSAQKVVIVR